MRVSGTAFDEHTCSAPCTLPDMICVFRCETRLRLSIFERCKYITRSMMIVMVATARMRIGHMPHPPSSKCCFMQPNRPEHSVWPATPPSGISVMARFARIIVIPPCGVGVTLRSAPRSGWLLSALGCRQQVRHLRLNLVDVVEHRLRLAVEE